MNTIHHISQDDLLLFALQFLGEGDATTAHGHLLACEDCRKQLAWVQGDLAGYALTAELVTPPAAARERLMRAIARDKRNGNNVAEMPAVGAVAATTSAEAISAATVPAAVESTPRRTKIVRFEDARVKPKMGIAGWAGWAVAAAAIVAGGLQYQKSEGFRGELSESRTELAQLSREASKASLVMETLTDSHTKQVSMALPAGTAPPAVPEGHASYLGKKGSLVFVGTHMNQLMADKTYELWLIPSGKGAAPIPAGTFRPDLDGRAHLVMASLPKDVDVAAFGVTIEPEGGSASPTLPIVLMGD